MSSINKKTGEIIVSPYSRFMHETVGLDVGSMIIQNYDFAWNDEIRDFVVVEGSKEDRQSYIDSFAKDCGVYNILKKYSISGDFSLLNQREGFYDDISDLPVDELNPSALAQKANEALDSLNERLGSSFTSEQLATMSLDEINSLIEKAVAVKVEKVSQVNEGKVGE